ncbi:MAG: hypothetical protein MPJ08_07650 [Nitrosopumilus sp.]|nr:hypothetical protein [Nitrosopumilus sp.]
MYADRRMLAAGAAMVCAGLVLAAAISGSAPPGTEGELQDGRNLPSLEEAESSGWLNLAGILAAVGFLLVLVSFGARRRR